MSEFSTSGRRSPIAASALAEMRKELSDLFKPLRDNLAGGPPQAQPGQYAGWGGLPKEYLPAGKALEESRIRLAAFKQWMAKAGNAIKGLSPQQRWYAFLDEGMPGATSISRNLALEAAEAARGGTQGRLANLAQRAAQHVASSAGSAVRNAIPKLINPSTLVKLGGGGMAGEAFVRTFLDPNSGELSIDKEIDEERQWQKWKKERGLPFTDESRPILALQPVVRPTTVDVGMPTISSPPKVAVGMPVIGGTRPTQVAVGEPVIGSTAAAGAGFDFAGDEGQTPFNADDVIQYLESLERRKAK